MSLTGRLQLRTAGALVAALFVGTALPSPGLAQSAVDVESARAYFVEATRLGKAGRWKEAREFYARSLVLRPAALTHYSLGVAQRETGRWTEALASFRAFLAEPRTAATRAYEEPARVAIAELEGRVGHVAIAIEPRSLVGLSLTIDGQPVPPLIEGPREFDPGVHEVVARAPGYRDAMTHFTLTAGGTATVSLVLATSVGLHAPRLAGAEAPIRPLVPAASPEVPPEPSHVSPIPIALLASGGALFGVGLAVGLVGVKEASNAPSSNGSDATSARTKATAGDIVASVGAVTAGVGLVLLLTQRRWATAGLVAPPRSLPWVARF